MSHEGAELATRRSELDLMKAQIAAIDAWNRARRSSERAAEAVAMTREMRLDLSRRMDARRREQQALVARVDEQLRTSGRLVPGRSAPRAILAHRNDWMREKVAARLTERGVVVVGLFDDGADAAGTLVVEQPEIVLVEDRLPTLSGAEVVRRARAFSPGALIGAQVMDGADVAAMVDAGASAVFTRRIPPAEVADQLLACLAGEGRELVLA